jgi:hypothetical protein
LLSRALYSLAHIVLAVQSHGNTPSEMAVVTLFLVLDLLVVAYCLGRIAGLHGERKVLGFWIVSFIFYTVPNYGRLDTWHG